MATKIKYTGFSHFRELFQKDFEKLGVKGQEALIFARHEVVEVEDDTADALMEFLGDEFEKVKADTKKAKADDKTPPAQSSTDAKGPA
jgi:hypothetical protein